MIENKDIKNLEKPLSLYHEEFKNLIRDAINKCQLPAFVIVDCLKIFANQVEETEYIQLKKDMDGYYEN